MSSIKRNLRFALHCLPVRAMCCVAGFALACAAAAQEGKVPENSDAKIDFASCPQPVYPQADAQAGHQGAVTIDYLVDGNGRVMDSKITHSSGFMRLDQSAQTALAKCSFHPALESGKPVQKWAHVKYVWSLR
jgi:D-alanyl-D-alanine endopeptidase (penicillin-binding protein 7)